MNLLYIDPGTGSLLFSIIIGGTAALYFLFRTFLLKIKIILSGGKKITSSKNKFVIYSEDKRYYSLFLPILEEFEKRSIDLLYLSSSQDDPVFDLGFNHIKPEFIGTGNMAFARLNFLSADIVLATTAGLDVYQWKRSKSVKHYCHILHSAGEITTYELFGMDYYDSILVNSDSFQKNDIRKLEKKRNLPKKQVITVGCPYLDVYSNKIKDIAKESESVFTVLVSPSWGKSALLSLYGEKLLDPLSDTNLKIIIRPHPQSLISEKDLINKLIKRYENKVNLEWDTDKDNVKSLSRADIMISDFSGIIFDYMFLRNKPVIYTSEKMDLRPYDSHFIYNDQNDMYTFQLLMKAGIELKEKSFQNIHDIIKNAVSNTNIESAICEAKKEVWCYQGEAGKKTVDFLLSITV